jgi:ABC-type nitrate/sulfonate/bicarbonate transport system ATPase subunit
MTGLTKFADAYPHTLSGGTQPWPSLARRPTGPMFC